MYRNFNAILILLNYIALHIEFEQRILNKQTNNIPHDDRRSSLIRLQQNQYFHITAWLATHF